MARLEVNFKIASSTDFGLLFSIISILNYRIMKKVNFILPVLAFFFAIVVSFASVNSTGTLADKRISLPAPSACQQISDHHCATGGNTLCTNGSVNLREYLTGSGTCGSTFNGTYEED
jgi:hypothetical protein